MKVIPSFKRRSILEITYVGEEGTGLGPTLEYYNLLGKELSADESLWRVNPVDGMLIPKPLKDVTE